MNKNTREKYLEKIEIEILQNKEKIQKEIDEFNKNHKLEIFLPNQYRCFSQVELDKIDPLSLYINNCIYIQNVITLDKVIIFKSPSYDISKDNITESQIDKEILSGICSFLNTKIEERIKWLKTYLAAIELISTRDEIEREIR